MHTGCNSEKPDESVTQLTLSWCSYSILKPILSLRTTVGHHWFQEEGYGYPSTVHGRGQCGKGGGLPLPGGPSWGGPDLGREHLGAAKNPLFELLPSGRWYQILKTRTNRLKNSFYSTAIATLTLLFHFLKTSVEIYASLYLCVCVIY